MNDWHRQMAEEIIRAHAENIEYGTVGEAIENEAAVQGVTDDEYSAHQRTIHDLIGTALVVITWPTT